MTIEHGPRHPCRRTVLVFPPVWVPMVPHLALPVLTAYLRQRRIEVTSLDANVEFFLNYLLTPETLSTLVPRARKLLSGKRPPDLPQDWLNSVAKELPAWEETIAHLGAVLSVFRDEQRFYIPDMLLPAMDKIQGLLILTSIAYWPGRISFNHYRRGDVWTEEDLVGLCGDEERNVFLPFWKDRLLPDIRQNSPILVGISISSVHQFVAALTLARLLRKELPRVHVVIGGKHVLRVQDKLVKHSFYFEKFIHSAIVHEGEQPLEALINALAQGKNFREVPNLIYLDREKPFATPLCRALPLDTLPYPDFSDVNWNQYLTPKRYSPIRMSEGCYWGRCTFCARYGEKEPAFISPERVTEELERVKDLYNVRDVSVNDDCMPPEYWEEVCSRIIKRKLDLSMLIWAKPVAGFTKRRLRLMAEAGVRQIRWGVESAHPRILKLMRKGTTLPTTRRVLMDSHEAGIWNHTCIILGFPTETREEAEATLDFIKTQKGIIQSFILYAFVLYQDSYVFQHPREFGIRDIETKLNPFVDMTSYDTERGMSTQEVPSLVRAAKATLLDQVYGWPFWYYLKLREYLQLYLDHYGLDKTIMMPFNHDGLRRV